ncbi:monovalent cation/H+ antiporter subunit D family protein [Nisaea sediminum]|uniref:monovalent cation/H+ antiporter subunit D family protein n=1 Tax=Nisaea sediminum TaxID=2775867 RepID=UPI00186828FC|nr:monovalent cation/H+ antiporter subunit D family protein [Nisaea sediminum]
MSAETALLATLLLPLAGTVLIWLTGKSPNLREAVTLITSVLLFAIVLSLLSDVLDGARPSVDLLEVMPGLSLAFEIEPLGMLFACIASGLWIVNSLYSIGYMRGNDEKKQTRFYMCFTIAISSAMGIAFAGNMFTLFVFYEILTLSTYPLVAHKETEEAKRGARIYLGILIGTSIGLQLAAIIWTWIAAGTLDFTAGGILSGKVDPVLLPVLLALYMFGIGKAALMPFHRWLPSAMVAPTPVSALLHAVAVVKAGVFTVLKVVVYIFGIDFLAGTGAANWLIWVASFTLLTASLVAMSKDNLKARLAYSTISQLAYIVLGAALANHYAILGGALHIATHAFGKITLFMCAGAIYVATHKTEISDMQGLGRKMPFTFAAFCIGAFSIIGLPPLAGTWSKWYLVLGAAESGMLVVVAIYMISSLLNIAYLMPIVARGFFRPAPELATASAGAAVAPSKSGIQEAPLLCVLPPCLTALGCFVLFFYADAIIALLRPIVE